MKEQEKKIKILENKKNLNQSSAKKEILEKEKTRKSAVNYFDSIKQLRK